MRRAAGLTALVLLLVAAPVLAADDQSELDRLREQIRESRSRVEGHEREQRELLEVLEQSDRLAAALSRRVRSARAEADRARERLEALEADRRRTRRRLDETREAMSGRVVALYKAGEVGPVRFLFGSADLPQMLSRMSALQTLVSYDAELLARYRRDRDALEAVAAETRAAAQQRDAAAAELEARSGELADEQRERRKLLASVRSDRSQERALLIELEKAARALEETLAALGDGPRDAAPLVGTAFASRRGALAPPVDAPVRKPFGRVVDEAFQTETFHKGVEFGAPAGASVRAVAQGIVRYAGWFRGYGRLVIVEQGDGYFTVVGHLDEMVVAVGDIVAEGDTLGTVGETGSLAGPSLYFELRRESEPLDPAKWLRLPVARAR